MRSTKQAETQDSMRARAQASLHADAESQAGPAAEEGLPAQAGQGALPEDPQALAELTARVMYARDPASQAQGMRIEQVAPGRSAMSMTVRDYMLNGHQTCHGGFIFTLADSAFAFACNSRNAVTVASGATIDFVAPAFEGDVLIAYAEETSLSGRTGVYDIRVENQDAKLIAMFRGRSYRIKGQVATQADAAD